MYELVYVPDDPDLKDDILRQVHDHPTAGHFGRVKTLELLSRNFYWPGFSEFVRQYIASCDVCQRCKHSRHKPYGPLQPLPVPKRPWASISLDHIVELPPSEGFNAILTVVCRLTKMTHFVPCCTTDSAADFARIFLDNVHKLHGLPEDIVSDRGSLFVSNFHQEVCKMLGTKLNFSTAYHPQSDGQTERINQIIEQYLRLYCNYLQDNWVSLLPLAEFAYNNTISQTINMTPFFANYGYHPNFQATVHSSTTPAAEEHVKNIQDVHNMPRNLCLKLKLSTRNMQIEVEPNSTKTLSKKANSSNFAESISRPLARVPSWTISSSVHSRSLRQSARTLFAWIFHNLTGFILSSMSLCWRDTMAQEVENRKS
jgi:hypothetical protein